MFFVCHLNRLNGTVTYTGCRESSIKLPTRSLIRSIDRCHKTLGRRILLDAASERVYGPSGSLLFRSVDNSGERVFFERYLDFRTFIHLRERLDNSVSIFEGAF